MINPQSFLNKYLTIVSHSGATMALALTAANTYLAANPSLYFVSMCVSVALGTGVVSITCIYSSLN